MKKIICTLVAALSLASPAMADELVFIVNASNTEALSPAAIQNIYLGKTTAYPSGVKAVPLMLEAGPPELEDFLVSTIGKNTSQYRAFWSRLMFSGQGTPPQNVKVSKDAIAIVERNPDAIGVVWMADAKASSKVKIAAKAK